ncbi:MAG: dienelactone hydrolase family protein [Acidimicrobiales bacterium]
MTSTANQQSVTVADGAVPVDFSGPDDASSRAGVVIVPSIFGPNEDLLAQMATLADGALTAVVDPFWRQGGGALPYTSRDAAFARVGELDRAACRTDVEAVAAWMAERNHGRVVGLGICFGGPFVLTGAAGGHFAGAVTWHGSRMEGVLDQLDGLTAPLRLHFGDADPITPPEVIDAVRTTFADHPDCSIVIHPGADHGYSHEGPAYDRAAADAGMADLRALIEALVG